jgi:hypothetical protein
MPNSKQLLVGRLAIYIDLFGRGCLFEMCLISFYFLVQICYMTSGTTVCCSELAVYEGFFLFAETLCVVRQVTVLVSRILQLEEQKSDSGGEYVVLPTT